MWKKTAIVTGSTRGIGLAIARLLAQDGCNIVIVGTREIDNYMEVKEIVEANDSFRFVTSDVSTPEGRRSIVDQAIQAYGRIDILVNNAGVAPLQRSDLLEMTEESFDRVVGINTKGTMFLTQLVAKQMISQELRDRKRGVIVNISSCSSTASSTFRGEYCVSKAGISMLTLLYADRLAKEGILVYEVRPGIIMTDMTSGVKKKYDELIEQGVFPIERWGTPEDVANAVSAFCSDKFLYSTGNYIDIDGGFHIKRL